MSEQVGLTDQPSNRNTSAPPKTKEQWHKPTVTFVALQKTTAESGTGTDASHDTTTDG